MFNGIPFECVELSVFSADLVRTIKTADQEALLKRPKYERFIIEKQLSGATSTEVAYDGKQLATLVHERLTVFGFTCTKIASRKNAAGIREHYFNVSWETK